MELWPPWFTLVLISMLTMCHDGRTQSAFTIDSVELTLLPGNTVESGTEVTLRCKAKVSHSFTQLTHTFAFLKYNTVIYSKNSSEAMVEHSFTPARAYNTGSYTCHIQVHKKKKSSNTEILTVKGLQTPQLRVQPDVVYEGEAITVTCSAPEEIGGLYFSFYEKTENIMSIPSNNNSATITKELQKLGETFLYCNYKHMLLPDISNNSNTVKVTVKELNIIPSINIQPHTDVVEGDRIHITCNVSGYSRSGHEVFLTKEKLLHFSNKSFTYSLEVRANNSGKYVCKVEKGKAEKTSTAELIVTELFSRPVLSVTPKQVFLEQIFSLSCRSPKIFRKRITDADVKYTLYKNQHLLKAGHIFNFTASQASNGNYTCRATAKGITKESNQLTINAKVPVSPPVIRAVGQVIIRKPFQILCESKLGTLPITYTLLRFNRSVGKVTVTGPLHSALFNVSYINHIDEIHSFICQAQNQEGGERKSSGVLNAAVIEPVSKPELSLGFPRGHTFTEGMDVSLYCSVQRGTVPVTFSWYRTGITQPIFTARFSRTKEQHIIRSITRDHRGKYYCEAFNDANGTQRSEAITVGVNLAGWKKAIIAVICIFILVLIVAILVLFLKKARAPRKRKRAVELSVKPARPKSNDPMRMSLTLDFEDNTAVNTTPGVMGRNVWSEHVSDSESDDPSKEAECQELQYTEVHPQQTANAEEAPMTQDTDTANGEVQDCPQGAPDEGTTDSAVEYVQLNHCEQDPE
ncbi:platelet endothelial cell adhesion molecule [Salminus brasiliensis]|uniref:platelet endothelial cell adhesion molecule n=1 Tax=Salminus brasiliensis TaxID=930266 RepID=UPI003B831831